MTTVEARGETDRDEWIDRTLAALGSAVERVPKWSPMPADNRA